MSAMKHFAALAILFISSCAPASAQEQKPEQKPENSQERQQDRYVPRLNTLMMVSQLGHFKLWYAGAVQNWALANYELGQIRANMTDAKNLYPNNSKSNMSIMTTPADDLDDAIKAKDSAKFVKAFSKLTAACNSCHEAAGFGFIKISRSATVADRDLAVQRRVVFGQVICAGTRESFRLCDLPVQDRIFAPP